MTIERVKNFFTGLAVLIGIAWVIWGITTFFSSPQTHDWGWIQWVSVFPFLVGFFVLFVVMCTSIGRSVRR